MVSNTQGREASITLFRARRKGGGGKEDMKVGGEFEDILEDLGVNIL